MIIQENDIVKLAGGDGELGRVCRVDVFTCQVFFVESGCLMVNTDQLEPANGVVPVCPDGCG